MNEPGNKQLANLPLISVVIPAFNAEKTISRAIESVLTQSYPNVEIIVVDDYSTDNTLKAVEPYLHQVKLVKHAENLNGAAARNNGVKMSSGEYLAFLDSDDSFLPEKLEVQLNTLLALSQQLGKNVCLACGEVGSNEVADEELIRVSAAAIFKKEFNFNTSSILLSRFFFELVDGFDEKFLRHQDLELFVRLAKEGGLFFISSPLLKREFSGSPSFQSTKSGIETFWNKFKSDIAALPSCDRRRTRALGFRRLAELAFNEGNGISFFIYLTKSFFMEPKLVFNKLPYYIRRTLKIFGRKLK